MYKITENLSKTVLSLADAADLGLVTNACVSAKLSAVKGWLVASEEHDDEGMIELRRVLGQKDALTVMNTSAVKAPRGMRCPLGAKVYDSEGTFIGILRDLLFREEDGHTTSLIVDEIPCDPSLVMAASLHSVILRAPSHQTLRTRRAPSKQPRKKVKNPLPLFNLAEGAEATSAAEPQAEAMTESAEPKQEPPLSTYGEYAFLLGRVVSKEIRAADALIAAEGSEVNARIIESARAHGKLVELTVNSKKA